MYPHKKEKGKDVYGASFDWLKYFHHNQPHKTNKQNKQSIVHKKLPHLINISTFKVVTQFLIRQLTVTVAEEMIPKKKEEKQKLK
jgi:hypothetical protein